METKQLENLLQHHPATRHSFGGVLALDQLPIRATKTCYVINLDESREPGSHWVEVYFGRSGIGEYFDSYGLPPYPITIRNLLSDNSVTWKYNSKQLKDVRTTVCGQYCAFYLIMRSSGISMDRFISQFSNSRFLTNDRYVRNFIYNMLKFVLPLYQPKV